MRKFYLAAASVLLVANSYAVTLEEALVSSYNNNEELYINRNNFLTEIEKFPRALAGFMPKISIQSQVTDLNTKRDSTVPIIVRDNITNKSTRYTHVLVAEQPVFDGFSSMHDLRSAQAAFKAARSDFYSKEQDILLKNIEIYLDCVASEEKYKISQMSVKSNKVQFDAMQEKFKQGEATATDVASAKESYKSAEANMATALANRDFRYATFKQVTNILPENLKMPELPDGLVTNVDELFEIAGRTNLTIDGVRNKIVAAKADSAGAKGQLLPKVSFKIQTDKTKYNVQKNDNGNINSRGLTSTLSVNIPILSRGGAEYSDIRKANHFYKRTMLTLDSSLKQLKAECVSVLSGFESAKKRLDATNQAVKSSEIAYDGMVQEEMLGSKTIIDVSIAEDRLSRARERLVDTQKDLLFTAYRLKSLTGELTAKALNLSVDYFEPEKEFKRVKFKIVGFK